MALPPAPDFAAFDALHDDPAAWRAEVASIARELGVADDAALRQETAGTVLVARLGDGRVLKLYPPFLRDHFEFERAMLARLDGGTQGRLGLDGGLQGRLVVPTPRLLASGEREGWPYLVMTELAGEPLTATWPVMDEPQRLALLHTLGTLAAQVHALPVGDLAALTPSWPAFVARQRGQCLARQQRVGLPPALLQALPRFLEGPVPGEHGDAAGAARADVLLTGEYTPMNLLTTGHRLSAMFDFGDGLVGPREYDWLGPLCFLAAGHAPRCAAFMQGYGATLDAPLRLQLMRLLLLHRYSHPPAQIRCEGWQQATSFEEVVERLWPLA